MPSQPPKRSSYTIIFSIATLMIGSTVVTLPWVIAKAGLILGILIVLFSGYISCYTAILVLRNTGSYTDFSSKCKELFGTFGHLVAQFVSALVLVVALVAFHIFLSQNLDQVVRACCIFAEVTIAKWWNTQISALFIALLLFFLVLIPNLSLLIKLSSFGIIAVLAVSVIIIYTGVTPPHSMDLSGLQLVAPSFPTSVGVLSMSFFVHNLIPQLCSNAANPKHNNRNVVIGFTIDIIVYILVGVTGFLGYHHYTDPETGEENVSIKDNYLLVLAPDNGSALIARVFLIVQMLVSYPVMFRQIRITLFSTFCPQFILDLGRKKMTSESENTLTPGEGNTKEVEMMGTDMSGNVITAKQRAAEEDVCATLRVINESAQNAKWESEVGEMNRINKGDGDKENETRPYVAIRRVVSLHAFHQQHINGEVTEGTIFQPQDAFSSAGSSGLSQSQTAPDTPPDPSSPTSSNQLSPHSPFHSPLSLSPTQSPPLALPSPVSSVEPLLQHRTYSPHSPLSPSITPTLSLSPSMTDKQEASAASSPSSINTPPTSPSSFSASAPEAEPLIQELSLLYHILPFSVILVAIPLFFAIFYPSVGDVLRFAGSFCGFVYIYTLPCLCEIFNKYKELRNSSQYGQSRRMSCVVSVVLHSIFICWGFTVFILQFIF